MTHLSQHDAVAWLRGVVPLSADLTTKSGRIKQGDVFIAYPGQLHDGRKYIPEAIERGAAAVVYEVQNEYAPPAQVASYGVAGLKQSAGEIAAAWYGRPSERLFSIGVTGTSGKSTSALWLAQLFEAIGHRPALVGTLGAGRLGALQDTGHTTPDPVDVQRLLARLAGDGVDVLAMEVTSVGLVEGRVNGLHFDIALFTNLTRDHLDYHGSWEAYREAKAMLFGWPGLIAAVINVDDPASQTMRDRLAAGVHCTTFSAAGDRNADLYVQQALPSEKGILVRLDGRFGTRQFDTHIVGRFNLDNLLGVIAVALAAGINFDEAIKATDQIKPAPGRLEPVYDDAGQLPLGPLVLIDYAHKPDALEKVLEACRPIASQRAGKLIAIFGCGGDRDKGKRPLMGEIGARLADQVVLTSDNPRSEIAEQILSEIYAGIPQSLAAKVSCDTERRRAIHTTLLAAANQDVVLIAGKGHEAYQEVAGIKTPFSDHAEARLALAARVESRAC